MSGIAAQCCDAGKGGYSLEALLVDIQRGSLHDGPGVRTTFFFKGCAVGGAIIRRVKIPESSCRFIVRSALDAGAVKRHVTVMYIG